jgi:Ca-activated chloride channel family protein
MTGGFYFAQAWWLLGIVLAAAYLVKCELSFRKKRRSIAYPLGSALMKMNKPSRWFGRVSFILTWACILFLSLALARPTFKTAKATITTEGIAILLTMDVSGSMLAEDFQPSNRMDVARMVLSDFVENRKQDRIGLVSFAGMPFLRCPLTTDHKTLLRLLNDLKAVRRQDLDGTAIGDALVASGQRLISAPEKSKIVVIVTDGENNKGQFDPLLAANMLKERNIKVYTVGIGTKGLVPYPMIDQGGHKSYQLVKMGFNEESLKQIAEKTGGSYYSASDKKTLEKVFAEIDRLEKSKVESPQYIVRKELFLYPLGLALLLISLAWAWEMSKGARLP